MTDRFRPTPRPAMPSMTRYQIKVFIARHLGIRTHHPKHTVQVANDHPTAPGYRWSGGTLRQARKVFAQFHPHATLETTQEPVFPHKLPNFTGDRREMSRALKSLRNTEHRLYFQEALAESEWGQQNLCASWYLINPPVILMARCFVKTILRIQKRNEASLQIPRNSGRITLNFAR